MSLTGHKGELPYPLYYDADRKVGWWNPSNEGWVDPRQRLNHVVWNTWGYDWRAEKDRDTRIYKPKDFWEWTPEELREEELEAIERIMQTPPVPLSQIGKTHGRHSVGWQRSLINGG